MVRHLDSLSLPSIITREMIINGDVNFNHTDWNKMCARSDNEKNFLRKIEYMNMCSISSSQNSPVIFMGNNLDFCYLEHECDSFSDHITDVAEMIVDFDQKSFFYQKFNLN